MIRRTAIWIAKEMPLHSKIMEFVVRFEPAKKTVVLSGPPTAMACWLRRFWLAVGAKLKRWRPCGYVVSDQFAFSYRRFR
jgi:hypothetical protein